MTCPGVFAIPIGREFLVYAPLSATAALLNRAALLRLRDAFACPRVPPDPGVAALAAELVRVTAGPPAPRAGALGIPLFLGLIPTRGCTLTCRYCDFVTAAPAGAAMRPELAAAAIDGYFDLLAGLGERRAEIQFFGGEPFHAAGVVHFAVEYALLQAQRLCITVRFEATTNGMFDEARCRWVADMFDTIVLSLDGPPDIQDAQRPGSGGRPVSQTVLRNAGILAGGPVELVLRACVSAGSVGRLAEIAAWFAETFQPAAVCFEVLSPNPLSEQAGLVPPDPLEFARNFDAADQVLAGYGVRAVLSTAELHSRRLSFCPVGQDALIVSPDGAVDGCYLPEERWRSAGLDMRLGRVNAARRFETDPAAVARLRSLNVEARPRCANCFCRYHCAGGCHVRQARADAPAEHDALCAHTRIVTAARLLRGLGRADLAAGWLRDEAGLRAVARARDDRLTAGHP